jgi:hypothetical protein
LIFSGWPRLFFDLPTLRVIFFGEDWAPSILPCRLSELGNWALMMTALLSATVV